MRPAIVWPEPPRWSRQELVRRLAALLRGRAERVLLIGSHAARRATADSDVDLILVHETSLPWPERGSAFADLRRTFGAMDLIVYTPSEWLALSRRPTPFLREARKTWVSVLGRAPQSGATLT
ncbi:MAG TPA: nucleotidyltransferase domain-containing protein [Myxococcales bacterium]|nr:nucleotidyltransferase domain-containing protein [Myxococcales bacterium]